MQAPAHPLNRPSIGVPVGTGSRAGGDGIAAADFATADGAVTGAALTMKRPVDRLATFAALIVYSMSVDAESPAPTEPSSGIATPRTNSEGIPLPTKQKTYLAGSKALDALAKLIQATEGYFHPSNYGSWALNLGRFLQNITSEFLKRWEVSSFSTRVPSCTPLILRACRRSAVTTARRRKSGA